MTGNVLLSPEQMVDIEKQYPEIDDPAFFAISRRVSRHTISDISAQWAFYRGLHHVVKYRIPGAIVECGVWNGGSILLAALALQHFGDTTRELYLYDTFEGMPEPGEVDKDWHGLSAHDAWRSHKEQGGSWGFGGTLDMVKAVVHSGGYPPEKLIFVKGLVEDTIPARLPNQIAILRLDTDLYGSTKHELIHAYPRLAVGGMLIVDDYGYFLGSRKATDEYIAENALPLFLSRVNPSVHVAIKPAG